MALSCNDLEAHRVALQSPVVLRVPPRTSVVEAVALSLPLPLQLRMPFLTATTRLSHSLLADGHLRTPAAIRRAWCSDA